MQGENALVLEIFKQETGLKMSLFGQQEHASTLRHYSQCQFSLIEIRGMCQEIISILNKVDNKGNLRPDSMDSLKKTGQLLWEHLLSKSVKEKLKTTQIPDLVLSIDEELIDVPWELLYDGRVFLCLKFNLGRLVRTGEESGPVQYRSFPSLLHMLVLANPTNDLKSAYLEGINIKNQFDKKRARVHIDFKSTSIDRMFVKKNLCDYDIVHFAGHCEYDIGDLKNTGWVFNDGKFSAADILTLGSSAPLPALIFSNACHSAKETSEFIDPDYQKKNYGFASAFLFSGVRHYLGATRKIEDRVSFSFAREFYTQLISGKSVGEAVRSSRLSLIKEFGILAIPWASYLLYGDPNFVLFRSPAAQKRDRAMKNTALLKKIAAGVSILLVIASISVCLYMWLPTLNPSTFFLLSRSRKAFLKGNNQEVISICERIINKEPLFLASYPLIGDAYRRLGAPDEALRYYFDYALLSEKKGDQKNRASAYIGIGWIYHLQGEYPKALEFYNKALALSSENKDKLNEADVLGKIAIWHMDKDDNDKALELLTKSSEINRAKQHIHKHRYNLACDYFNMGLLFTNKDDFATAKEFYNKSFVLFDKLKLEHELSDYYFNVGEIYVFQKEYQKALDFYSRGLKIDQRQGHLPNIAADYNMIGELYIEMDNLAEAEIYFNKAVLLCKDIKAPLELASAYYNLGLLYKTKGKKNMARDYLRQAQEIYTRVDTSEYEDVKRELTGLDTQ